MGSGGLFQAMGAAIGWEGDPQKAKPDVFIPTDIYAEQKKTSEANLEVLPTVMEWARKANEFLADERIKGFTRLIPGYQSKLTEASSTIDALLKGELPGKLEATLNDWLSRKTAEQGVAMGTAR